MGKKLNVVFYRHDTPIFDGVQHNFFHQAIWLALPELLGNATRVELDCSFVDVNVDDGFYFDPIEGDFDIAYSDKCVPRRKPAKFYFAVQSDWRGEEERIKKWMRLAHPDALLNMYSPAQSLIDACEELDIRYEYQPWFIVNKQPFPVDRPITALCTGAMGTHYVWRTEIAIQLHRMNRPDIISKEKMQTSYDEYLSLLGRTKYYCTGGTDDDIPEIASIPHKYFEACNYGCCLVSPDMPYMERAGFIDGETYIKLNSVEELSGILVSDRWKEIGRAGQQMVQRMHTVKARANKIIDLYLDNEIVKVCKEI